MKNLLIFYLLFSLVYSSIFQQYRVNKLSYNTYVYIHQPGDRYVPTLTEVTSFLVPGFWPVVARETGRDRIFKIRTEQHRHMESNGRPNLDYTNSLSWGPKITNGNMSTG